MSKYLFRITVDNDVWRKKESPIYLVEESKEHAKKLAEKHMKDGYSVKSVQRLAKQIAGIMFHGK